VVPDAAVETIFQSVALALRSGFLQRWRVIGAHARFPVYRGVIMHSIHLKLPRASRISDALLVVVTALIGLSLAGQCAKHLFGHTMLKGFVPTFYVDLESSVPTWYSSAALGLAGALFVVIAVAKFTAADKFRWHWATLGGLFFLLSVDEIAMIHELPIEPLREQLGAGGLLYFTWVIPGAIFIAFIGVGYLRFFVNLPRRTQQLLVLAGATFVCGAIGVEMLSGAQADSFGEQNFDYAMIVTLEELLEMLGVVVLIRCLLEYLETHVGKLQLQFAGK
jgi:hypothetical protein